MPRPDRRLASLAALALALGFGTSRQASAQAVGFQPVVGSFPNGVTLPVTPVVSADRRYVRMTLNPQFNAIEGFDPFSVPAAVSGGGTGGGGLGGLGGLGGAGGGGGGGLRSVSAGTYDAGMDGVAPAGQMTRVPLAYGTDFASYPSASSALNGNYRVTAPRLSQGLPTPPQPKTTAKAAKRAKAKTTKPSTRPR